MLRWFIVLAVAGAATTALAQPKAAAPSAAPAAAKATVRAAPEWRVTPAQSSIGFASSLDGAAFRGTFTRWTAAIRFDPANLPGSSVRVVIDPTSANSGMAERDGTLREADWFDTNRHRSAIFEATTFRSTGAGRYEAVGTLTIKGRATPVTLPFTLAITGANADMSAALNLDRTKLGLGAAMPVSSIPANVAVSIRVRATRM
jgi:polyisoprenoid-binding protein YceI